jgi:hypothetical protein
MSDHPCPCFPDPATSRAGRERDSSLDVYTRAKVASATPRSLASSRTGGTPTECLTAERKNQLNTKRNLDTDIVILFAHPHQFRFTQC